MITKANALLILGVALAASSCGDDEFDKERDAPACSAVNFELEISPVPPTVPLEADLLVAGTLHMDLAVLNDVAVDLGVCAVPSGSDAGSGSGSLLGTGVQSLCGTEDADVVYAFPAIVLGTGSDRTWSAMLPIAALLGAVGGEPGDVRISARASGGCSGDNSSARGSDTMAFEVAPPPDGGLDAGSASGSGSGSGSGSD